MRVFLAMVLLSGSVPLYAEPAPGAAAAAADGAGAAHAMQQAAMLGMASQEAKSSGSSDSSKMLEMMMLAQMMQAQKDKDDKKKNEDNDKKSKEGEDDKNKTVKWDLPKAVETKFEFKFATDEEYRKQQNQATNSELETVRAGAKSTGPRSNEFVNLAIDPFVLNSAAVAGNGPAVQGARPSSTAYDRTPIDKISKDGAVSAGTAGKPTKSELVPIAGDIGDRGAAGSLSLPQGVNMPFQGGVSSPVSGGSNPLGNTTTGDLGGAGDGHGGSASAGAGTSGGGSTAGGSRGIASVDSGGGSRAGTLPIGSDGGSSGSLGALSNFKSAEGLSLDGSPLYEGASMPIARREKDINLFEYATYRLKKIAFNEKRVRTSKETLKTLPPKQAGLLR